jgi:ketosteroid isomerase-like protein
MTSLTLSIVILAWTAAPAQDATATATQLLQAGAATFDTKDAAAMAATYTEDAEITLFTQSDSSLQAQQYQGKERIHKLYADLFKNAAESTSRNVVEYARFVGPDVLLIGGTFEPDVGGDLILQFVQVRVRQDGGAWRIRNLQLFQIPNS